METGKRDVRRNSAIINAAVKLNNLCQLRGDELSRAMIEEANRTEGLHINIEDRRMRRRRDNETGTEQGRLVRDRLVQFVEQNL